MWEPKVEAGQTLEKKMRLKFHYRESRNSERGENKEKKVDTRNPQTVGIQNTRPLSGHLYYMKKGRFCPPPGKGQGIAERLYCGGAA